MVDPVAVKVRPVTVAKFQTVPEVVMVMLELLIVTVRVLELLEEKEAVVTLLELVFKLPLVTVKVPEVFKASLSCQVPPTPLKRRLHAIATPLLAIVLVPLVALKVMVPVAE